MAEEPFQEVLTGNEAVMDAARAMFKAYDADCDGRVNLEGLTTFKSYSTKRYAHLSPCIRVVRVCEHSCRRNDDTLALGSRFCYAAEFKSLNEKISCIFGVQLE